MSPPESRRPQTPPQRRRVDEATARALFLSAATTLVKQQGVSAVTVADVLDATQLGTRIFYRNFASKDDLVRAVFAEMARGEARRLRELTQRATDPLHGVALWIRGRLDLAFDPAVRSELRTASREAQARLSTDPLVITGAFAEMLGPLIEQLQIGVRAGQFPEVPEAEVHQAAHLIHGTVWACTESEWTGAAYPGDAAVGRIIAYCLRGLGADPAATRRAVDAVI
ncbi:MAG TPA: helix-turn-helix domain-containing protein [Mycobacterium sp.]|nr:helix-turn-helix domain-containing protein [Mycobacterium sp.]